MADQLGVLSDNVVLSFDGRRVFPSTSPHGVGIWAEGELGKTIRSLIINLLTFFLFVDACDKVTYDYLRTQRHRSPSVVMDRGPTTNGVRPLTPTQEEEEDAASDGASDAPAQGETLKIILQSKVTKDISLTVRPTTTCSSIIKAFLKAAGLTDKYPSLTPAKPAKGRKGKAVAGPSVPQLSLDGEKLDPDSEIGDADLEDGDRLDVVGM